MASKSKTDILQGTLSLLVLKTLTAGSMHGYAITQHIRVASAELLRAEEGSLYPALHRMEQEGLLKSEWRTSETNRRARFYSLTEPGHARLAEEKLNWERLTRGVGQVLEFA